VWPCTRGYAYPLRNPFASGAAAPAPREPNMDHKEFEELMKSLAEV